MPELLLEVGCEELPATFVRKAYTDLGDRLAALLAEAGVLAEGATATTYGTPRRLIVSFADVAARQPDSEKEMRGPGLKGAYDADGKPTPALLGFCRGQGVDVSDVRNDGAYVWVTKKSIGVPTSELLAEILPKAIRGLAFDKSMRWGSTRMRFARPIRWLLAAFDGERVDFDIEGVKSGTQSYGHRFYRPEAFEAGHLTTLLAELRSRFVEPDADLRRQRIVDGAHAAATGTPELSDALVDENTFLTEWPTPILGTFDAAYQELPEAVLTTAMAKHEKMFPVRDADGKLLSEFIFVRNSGVDDSVRRGCEWVLAARFNDAKFFFDEDAKSTLRDFLDQTATILFQEKLGTVRQRADRLAALAAEVAGATGGDATEIEYARQAGLYAKADLATGLVSELASLQGVIGGEYARRDGLPEPVATAISRQYDHSGSVAPTDDAARTSALLVMADQLDKLAGYLGIGLEPSGSSDPYALRRAASILIELAWGWPGALPAYDQLLDFALQQYAAQGVELDAAAAHAALYDVFASRYPAMMPHVRHDVLNAAMLNPARWETTLPQGVRFRTELMARLVGDPALVQTATRPLNIVIAARRKGIEYGFEDPMGRLAHSALESAEGLELYQLLSTQEDALFKAAREERLDEAEALIRALQAPINRFFEANMVMVDDQPEVRYARLTLMHATSLQLLVAGDFSKLEG